MRLAFHAGETEQVTGAAYGAANSGALRFVRLGPTRAACLWRLFSVDSITHRRNVTSLNQAATVHLLRRRRTDDEEGFIQNLTRAEAPINGRVSCGLQVMCYFLKPISIRIKGTASSQRSCTFLILSPPFPAACLRVPASPSLAQRRASPGDLQKSNPLSVFSCSGEGVMGDELPLLLLIGLI